MKDLSKELEKLSHYYDSEMTIDINMSMVHIFTHKKTGKKYVYRLSRTDLKDFGPGVVKMFDELKTEIRDEKLNDLGL